MIYKKRRLFPLSTIGKTEFNYREEVEKIVERLRYDTTIEEDFCNILMEIDEECSLLDWYKLIDGNRIPFSELDDKEEHGEYDDNMTIYVLDDYQLISLLERYILSRDTIASIGAVAELFNIQRPVAVEVIYRLLERYILIERLDMSRQIISEFFDNI